MSSVGRYVLNKPGEFERLTRDVKKQITKAATDTVNITAAMARKELVSALNKEFITRNTFTARQAQFTQMPQKQVKSLDEIKATVGFTEKAEYMERQDEGGTHKAKKDYLAIPTDKARGGKNKRGAVRRTYYLSELENKKVKGPFSKNHKFGDPGMPKSAGVARAAVAFREKKLIHFGSGLFRVLNFRARKGKVRYRTEQIYILDRKETKTTGKHYFLPAVSVPAGNIQAVFNSQMDKAFGH
jgi:hypothetical protein